MKWQLPVHSPVGVLVEQHMLGHGSVYVFASLMGRLCVLALLNELLQRKNKDIDTDTDIEFVNTGEIK